MENAKYESFGLLGSAPSPGPRASFRKRAKRNPWVIVALFGLVVAAWINSQM